LHLAAADSLYPYEYIVKIARGPMATSLRRLNLETKAKDLLSHGADVNAQCKDGSTPLHMAAKKGFLGMAKVLVQHGADCRISDNGGRRAYDLAARMGCRAVRRFLRTRVEYTESVVEEVTTSVNIPGRTYLGGQA
jgi:ankyrin repeat protein